MTNYGVMTDYEYNATHKRDRLTIWTAPFMSTLIGEAYSLPRGDGYMISLRYGTKLRVACPAPRNETNYVEIDAAINDAMNDYYSEGN